MYSYTKLAPLQTIFVKLAEINVAIARDQYSSSEYKIAKYLLLMSLFFLYMVIKILNACINTPEVFPKLGGNGRSIPNEYYCEYCTCHVVYDDR